MFSPIHPTEVKEFSTNAVSEDVYEPTTVPLVLWSYVEERTPTPQESSYRHINIAITSIQRDHITNSDHCGLFSWAQNRFHNI